MIAGLVCGAQLNGRIDERNAVLDRSEPFAYAAQNLYAALSAADAAAASAFLSGGIETARCGRNTSRPWPTPRRRWPTRPPARRICKPAPRWRRYRQQLAAYTGLVEAARANNRQGFPIGSAYLREASSLMQTSLLPERREDLHRQSRHGRGRPARRRVAADRRPRAAGARPRGDRCRFGDHVSPHEPAVQHRARRRGGHRRCW